MTIYEPPAKECVYAAHLQTKITQEMRDGLWALAAARGASVPDLVREILGAALDTASVYRTTSAMKRREVHRG